MNNKSFLFSVIIPVYNVEKYLDEALKSIIGQSIGFDEFIEIILINNGTEDGSGEICKYFQLKYPKNIKYVELEENVGPSGARNLGIQYATGTYINYFDSDDKWGRTAFDEVSKMFELHPKINVMACREKRFDAYDSRHIFDYIFDNQLEIIDILEKPDCVWFAAHSLFFRREILEEFKFDESLSDSEDMKFVNQIILNEQRYGIVRNAVYYYRERSDGTSLVQNYTKKRYWYFYVLPNITDSLIDLSKQLYGECLPYLRWLIMFNLQGRTRSELPSFFTRRDCENYRAIIRNLLQNIDDSIILQQRLLNQEQKFNVLCLKYGNEFCNQIYFDEGTFYYCNKRILRTQDEGCLSLEFLDVKNNYIEFIVRESLPELDNSFSFYVKDNFGNRFDGACFELDRSFLDRRVAPSITKRKGFIFRIPLKKSMQLSFVLSNDKKEYLLNFRYGKFFPLTNVLKHSHLYESGWLIYRYGESIYISKSGFLERSIKQFFLCKELFNKRKKTALIVHIYKYLWSLLPKIKEIWVFSDRAFYAGDNGEKMFHYVNQKNNHRIRTYFALDEKSPDFEKIKQIGKGRIVSNRSKKYKLLFLIADKIISSHFDGPNVYPLERHREYIKDLLRSKLIYLQHGVIKDDVSGHDSKLRTGASGFVVSAYKEYDSMFSEPYGYKKDEVWFTGQARYDSIYDCDPGKIKKVVLVAPTWRNSMTGLRWSPQDGLIMYTSEFKKSDYYKFYNSLLNDERLLEVMRRKNYKGIFRLHPVLRHFAKDFIANDIFSIEQGVSDYRYEIETIALLITDYSSTAFDYAYALKPCIYAQFDVDTFSTGHTYVPGYFDYHNDGFGPVCFDYDTTIKAIIKSIESDCVLEEKYLKRAKEFFKYRDGNNCERIYQQILKI